MSLYAAGKGEDRKLRILREKRERRDLRKRLQEAEGGGFEPITLNTPEECMEFLQLAEEAKWISKAIKHPGRCTGDKFGGSDCPKGSPQYNLAVRLKPGGDLYQG